VRIIYLPPVGGATAAALVYGSIEQMWLLAAFFVVIPDRHLPGARRLPRDFWRSRTPARPVAARSDLPLPRGRVMLDLV
jgi:hypothetical protein